MTGLQREVTPRGLFAPLETDKTTKHKTQLSELRITLSWLSDQQLGQALLTSSLKVAGPLSMLEMA